jgi:biopolymer transport protein ExbB
MLNTLAFILLQITSPNAVTDTAAALGTTPPSAKPPLTLLELIMKGGWVMYPIIILLFFTIYLLIERYITIRKFSRSNATDINNFFNLLKRGDDRGALDLANTSDNKVLKVLETGVQRLGRPASEIEEGMSSRVNIMISRLQQRLTYLGIIAGIAPMLGFIGTISGIIRIFYDISVSENISIGIIASGLYEKMVSSGSGLIVGIIAYAGYHSLLLMIDIFAEKVESSAFDFMNIIQQPSA